MNNLEYKKKYLKYKKKYLELKGVDLNPKNCIPIQNIDKYKGDDFYLAKKNVDTYFLKLNFKIEKDELKRIESTQGKFKEKYMRE